MYIECNLIKKYFATFCPLVDVHLLTNLFAFLADPSLRLVLLLPSLLPVVFWVIFAQFHKMKQTCLLVRLKGQVEWSCAHYSVLTLKVSLYSINVLSNELVSSMLSTGNSHD